MRSSPEQHGQVRFLWLCLLAVLPAGAGGCGKPAQEDGKSGSKADARPAPVARVVKVTRPKRASVTQEVEQPGYIKADETALIYANIKGYVRKVLVDIGSKVSGPSYDSKGKLLKEGQVLAELSVPELDKELNAKAQLIVKATAQVTQAEQSQEAAKAHVRTTASLVKEADAGVLRARANVNRWQGEYDRLRKLGDKVIDKQVVDETEFQLEAAKAAQAEAEAKVHSAKAVADESRSKEKQAEADVGAARANEKVIQAQHDQSRALWEYTRITAPFPGVVTWRHVDPGDLVQPGLGKGGKGEPLLIVARNDRVRIAVDVPETAATWVQLKTPAAIRLRGLLRTFSGEVTRTSWALDSQARTLRVEIDTDNPKDALHPRGIFQPGGYASVTLTLEHQHVWTLPAAAIAVKDDQPYCYRLEDDKAVRTPLEIGLSDGKRTEVLRKLIGQAKGKKGGRWEEFTGKEIILDTDPAKLTDGQQVKKK